MDAGLIGHGHEADEDHVKAIVAWRKTVRRSTVKTP